MGPDLERQPRRSSGAVGPECVAWTNFRTGPVLDRTRSSKFAWSWSTVSFVPSSGTPCFARDPDPDQIVDLTPESPAVIIVTRARA